jgi:hypothetical protein
MVAKREELFRQSVRGSVEDYQELLELGMPLEDARIVFLIGTKVNFVILQAVGGCGMAVGAIYEVFSKDPAEFTVGKYTVWTLVLAALLIVIGGAIRLVS